MSPSSAAELVGSLLDRNPHHNLWLLLVIPKLKREATAKRVIFISCAAALALLISVPTGAGAVGVGKQCGGFVIHPQECNHGLVCQRQARQCFIAHISGTCSPIARFFLPHFRPA